MDDRVKLMFTQSDCVKLVSYWINILDIRYYLWILISICIIYILFTGYYIREVMD